MPTEGPVREQWSDELADAIDSVSVLLARLGLSAQDFDADLAPSFPLRVPASYLARMRRQDAADPLLRQVLPVQAENVKAPGYRADALEEGAATLAPGLIKKYAGRALLIAAPACAVHCRYCFRRAFPYADHRLGVDSAALRALARDTSVSEVILSGGDPLMLKDSQLDKLLTQLETFEHLRRLRIHTRLPVVIPSRITSRLVSRLRDSRLRTAFVVHINHPNEIDDGLESALWQLADSGIQVLNQSVLLAGVNDDAATLVALSERLFAAKVLPYYLHMPDQVTGTQHFDVSLERALELYKAMQHALPGYLMPRLAREVPGAAAKQWLLPTL